MKRRVLMTPRDKPANSKLIGGRYIRKWDDILLLPKYIDVEDLFFDEADQQMKIKYKNDHGEEKIANLDFLTNFCRNEKEKRHAKFHQAGFDIRR